MKTGDIVYLCEEEFIKFRNLHSQMKTSNNLYEDNVKSSIIENKFILIALFTNNFNESEALISFQNEIVDTDIYNNCSIDLFNRSINFESCTHNSLFEIKDSIIRRSIISKKGLCLLRK